MKIVTLCLAVLMVFAGTTITQAQTADEIIDKHFEAIGGKEKIGQMLSLYIEGSAQVMGNDNPTKTTIVNGKGFKNVFEFNGTEIIQCFTDKGGWAINPMMGATSAQAMSDNEYKAGKDGIYVGGPLFDYAAKGSKVELLGTEKVGDADAYKIKVTSADNVETTFFIDTANYYITKMIRNFDGQETTTVYSNFQKTDFGTISPFALEVTLPQGFTINLTTTKVEVNKEIDPVIFDMPK